VEPPFFAKMRSHQRRVDILLHCARVVYSNYKSWVTVWIYYHILALYLQGCAVVGYIHNVSRYVDLSRKMVKFFFEIMLWHRVHRSIPNLKKYHQMEK